LRGSRDSTGQQRTEDVEEVQAQTLDVAQIPEQICGSNKVVLVADTFGPETRFAAAFGPPVFSDPDSAKGHSHPSFGRLDAGGFWLDHDVPLNGAFSDLTAQFEFESRRDRYAVIVHDLRVL
jgi:hypothetical protein